MNLPGLKIGDRFVDLPIIQGGMAVSVSTAELACAVADEGGIGVIGATGLSMEELKRQLREARAMTKGILGLNIMVAARSFKEVVYESVRQKVDVIIAGAGFSKDVFGICKEWKTPLITMVSSVKAAKLAERLGGAAVIVEGRDAGGHLGTEEKTEDLLPAICKAVSIPAIAAGGFVDGKAISRVMALGAAGVQMGTRFLLSSECTVHDNFKELLLKSKISDLVRILSPVGLPANAIKTPLVEKLLAGDQSIRPDKCNGCLKHCSGSFCILEALKRARNGDYERGLFFTGSNFPAIKKILSVKEIIGDLMEEARACMNAGEVPVNP
ncbi:MAG: nitronate monooxygenase [Deltaproteobacteria bacterium]|nr:nitronate monooxygenase [Candidatus Tharpellaceae bacterium]